MVKLFVLLMLLAAGVVAAAFYAANKQNHPKVNRGERYYLTIGDQESGVIYQLIDNNRKVIYKAVFNRKVSDDEYVADFVNCVKKHSTERTIGTKAVRCENPAYAARPAFTYEGVNIWDYLSARNIKIEATTTYSDKTTNWVYRYGDKMAVVEKAGHHHSDTTYRVRIFDDNIYLVFLAAFTLATLGNSNNKSE